MGNPERDSAIKISKPFNGPGGPNCSMMPGELVSVIPVEGSIMMPGELEPSLPQEAGTDRVLPQDQQPGA